MKISQKIINIRNDNNLTQEEFAQKLFVSRQTVSNWENGKCYPDMETLIMICDKFNISLDSLIKEDKEMIKDIDKKVRFNKRIKFFILIFSILLLIFGIVGYKYHLLSYYDYEYYDSTLKEIAENTTVLEPKRNMELSNTKFYDMNIYIPENLEKDDIFEFDYNLGDKDAISLYKYDNPFYTIENEKEFFKNIDYQEVFQKYSIYNPVDLIRYFEDSYDITRSILWPKDGIQLNFLAKQFVTKKMNFNGGKGYKIYYWFNFNYGYMIESKNYYSINIYDGNDTYYIGINKNVYDFEETLEIISSIYFG